MKTPPLLRLAIALVCGWVLCYTSGIAAASRDTRRQEMESDLWEHQRDAAQAGRTELGTAAEVLVRFVMGVPADLVWRWEQRALRASSLPARGGAGERKMQDALNGKWALLAPVVLAVLAVGVGLSNLAAVSGENSLRDVVGSTVGAGIVGGFLPAAILVVGAVLSWRSPAIGAAVTLGLVFLYFGGMGLWMSLDQGWRGDALLTAFGTSGAVLYLVGLAVSRRRPKLGGPFALVGGALMASILYWTLVMPVVALGLGVFGLRRAQQLAGEQSTPS